MLGLLRQLSWPELRHHPWRNLAALLAVMLGVALAFSVHLINASALSEFSAAVRSVNGDPDFELRAQRGGFEEGLYGRVALHRQVAVASPVVEVETRVHVEEVPVDLRSRGTARFAAGARALPEVLAEQTQARLSALYDVYRLDVVTQASTPPFRTLPCRPHASASSRFVHALVERGLAEMALNQHADAAKTFEAILAEKPDYLAADKALYQQKRSRRA